MSETDVGESAPGNAGLYDATGATSSSGDKVEDLVRFAREQPVATAVGALVLGYISASSHELAQQSQLSIGCTAIAKRTN